MSYSVTVEITLPATRFPQFVDTLARLLEEPDRSVLSGIDWTDPTRFAAAIEQLRANCTGDAAICLTFAFEADPVLLAFRAAHADIRSTQAGTVPVGCVWTGFQFGPERVVASFTSATSSIAEVLRDSASARGTLRGLAYLADATSAVLVDEWGDWSAL